ncbi:hypothetical protein Gohar_021951, partial [Gossypium harknessii]|nr:hypothetical protein [Gossypium harknessii]
MPMLFGKEAKQELVKLVHGKCLRVLVYGEYQYSFYAYTAMAFSC